MTARTLRLCLAWAGLVVAWWVGVLACDTLGGTRAVARHRQDLHPRPPLQLVLQSERSGGVVDTHPLSPPTELLRTTGSDPAVGHIVGGDLVAWRHALDAALRRTGGDRRLLHALAQQESSRRPVHTWYPDGGADLGVFQVSGRTARAYGCDLNALLAHDPDASVWCAWRVLKDKRRQCLARGVPAAEAWGCYHSFTPAVRARYIAAVRRWL